MCGLQCRQLRILFSGPAPDFFMLLHKSLIDVAQRLQFLTVLQRLLQRGRKWSLNCHRASDRQDGTAEGLDGELTTPRADRFLEPAFGRDVTLDVGIFRSKPSATGAHRITDKRGQKSMLRLRRPGHHETGRQGFEQATKHHVAQCQAFVRTPFAIDEARMAIDGHHEIVWQEIDAVTW